MKARLSGSGYSPRLRRRRFSAAQVAADGAKRVVVVTDEPHKYPSGTSWPTGLTIRHRDELLEVETELAGVAGVTVLIYDQTCAAEKRRRRKRGEFPDPDKRAFINELVCEGCGDCGVKSNCVSIQPKETEFGRKRAVDQSNCNKDFSCVDGFCPSFVTVRGAKLRKAERGLQAPPSTPEPERREILDRPYSILITGVGGTGVVTIGAILGMAAHLENKGAAMIDMAGLAQKGGAVFSHVKLARRPEDIRAIRVAASSADLVLGCDFIVSGERGVLAAMRGKATGVVVNAAEVFPGDFTRQPDFSLPTERLRRSIETASGGGAKFIDATTAATALLGASIGANMFMLGYAYQAGYVPLSSAAIRRAIELNGEAVAMNQAAFDWGRAAFVTPEATQAPAPAEETLETTLARRVEFLTQYQNRAYAERYERFVRSVAEGERAKTPGRDDLALVVAKNLFKLMAYKDEYEVARLYVDGAFQRKLEATFEGDLKLEFHLAPPLFAKRDPSTGHLKKMRFGAWMMTAFKALASLRGLRGTALDPFGRTQERREERALIGEYEALIREIMSSLGADNHAQAVALASLPEKIRGFGHVKTANLAKTRADWSAGVEAWRSPQTHRQAAE